ncbi:class I SAM-dependent methyltransferase [Lysobacter panacisoli]|uniref:Methyltransferase domain-containing protein n=1 Tax=Lysobacter panacisoli TaxID=1255263 RepID=A0ABP9LJE2_9GAMM|nr:methyltransferase domain-containing protein [Lysobacter panacisoli]
MPGYFTRNQLVPIGGHTYRLRVLSDKTQVADPDGHGARLGMSAAQWSLFGQVWPAGRLLAQAMHRFDIAGKRILELGCGIGLASLVLQRRGADVVASDVHPLAEGFLAYNAALNALPTVQYRQLRWDVPLPSLGHFDVIIAGDVFYERDDALLLIEVIARHACPDGEVLVTDPGGEHSSRLNRLMARQGFETLEERCPMDDRDTPPYRGRLLHYTRAPGVHA